MVGVLLRPRTPGKETRWPMYRRLCRSQSGKDVVAKRKISTLPGTEPQSSSLSPATILSELRCYLYDMYGDIIFLEK
jgi:hypothetical protein